MVGSSFNLEDILKSLIRTVSLLAIVCITSPVNSSTTAYDTEANVPAEIANMAIEAYMRFGREGYEIHSENSKFLGSGMRGTSIGFVHVTDSKDAENRFSGLDPQPANLMTVPISATFPMLLGGYLGIAFFGRKRPKETR